MDFAGCGPSVQYMHVQSSTVHVLNSEGASSRVRVLTDMAEFDTGERFSFDEDSECEEDSTLDSKSTGLSSEEDYESICSQNKSLGEKIHEISDLDDDSANECDNDHLMYVDDSEDSKLELATDTWSESTLNSCDLAVLEPQASMDPLVCKDSVITETESCLLLLQYSLR